MGWQYWIFLTRVSPTWYWLSISTLGRRHDTAPSRPIGQYNQGHSKVALRRLSNISSRLGFHLHQGRQCGHEASHVVYQHWPLPTETPFFRTRIIYSLFEYFHCGLQDSEFHLFSFWLFFFLSTYWYFAPASLWSQLRAMILKVCFCHTLYLLS